MEAIRTLVKSIYVFYVDNFYVKVLIQLRWINGKAKKEKFIVFIK